MGIVQSLLTRRKPAAASSAGGDFTGMVRIGGSTYSSRWHFTRILDSVYANPTARRCVEYIANDFQRPDWQLRNVGTEDDIDPTDERYNLFNKPGGITSGTAMQYHISRDLDLSGGTTWLKVRGNGDDNGFGDRGPVTRLRRLAPHRVTIIADDDDELLGFIYSDRMGRIAPLLPEEVVYVNYPHPDRPADRMAPALVAGLPAETDTAAMKFNFELLSNDSALPGYLVVEGLTTSQFQEWALQWESGESPGKTRFIKGSNAKYVKVGQTNQELTYTQLRQASQEDICRSFGPSRVLIDPTDATFSNMDRARTNYMVSLITPRWTLVGDAFSMQLSDDIGADIGFKLDDIEELQEGMKAYVERTVPLIDRDVITINEVRKDLGLDEVEWGNVPLSMMRAGNTAPAIDTTATEVTRDHLEIDIKSLDATLLELEAGQVNKNVTVAGIDAPVSRFEKRAQSTMTRFFERQGNAIAARYKSAKSKKAAGDDERWWDQDRWDTELGESWMPILADTVEGIGTLAFAAFDPDGDFDVETGRITSYLENRSVDIAALINNTTKEDVRRTISGVMDQGGTIDEAADAIKQYFTDSKTMRAERVARTEIIGAANWGQIEAARQTDLVEGKTWLAASDAEEDCVSLSGTVVGLDDSFGPVDQPPLHPNCRCTLTFTMKDASA